MKKDYNKKKNVGVRLTPEVYYKIKYISIKTKNPMNRIIENYLLKYIEAWEQKNGAISSIDIEELKEQ